MCRQDALLTAARALGMIRPERIAARQEAPIPPDEFDRFPKPSDNRTRLREIRKDWKRDDGTPLRPEPRLPAGGSSPTDISIGVRISSHNLRQEANRRGLRFVRADVTKKIRPTCKTVF